MKIKNRYTGKVICEIDGLVGDNLSGADLCRADLSGADLSRADLSGADLRGAVLSDADLRGAVLSSANLSSANLCRADLSGACLSGAVLRNAYLCDAILSDADLASAVGNMMEVKSMQADRYAIVWTAEMLHIGCEAHKISDWWDFSDEEIESMAAGALEWWEKWKPILQEIIRVSPARSAGLANATQETELEDNRCG